ncbi:MAG: S-layer homology domain-containing protein, partial [Clostridiales bacterium]|nr:S-layer homology domain-containing protein [Clostridiales bacterium]
EIIQPEIPTPLPIQTYTLNDIKTPEYFKTRDFINGYENKTFKPDQNLTRAEAAQMFYKISYDGTKINFETLNKFNDINEKDWFSNSVAYLANKNLVQGFENKFNPNEKITRAEFSQLIFNVLNNYADKDKILILGKYDTNFEDIENSFAKKVIKQLASNNFVNGYDFKNFKPQDNITRAESIVMITKVFKRDISENKENIFIDLDRNHWAYRFIVSCAIV